MCTSHLNSDLEEQQLDASHDHRIPAQHTAGEAVLYLTLSPLVGCLLGALVVVYQHPLASHSLWVLIQGHQLQHMQMFPLNNGDIVDHSQRAVVRL